MSGADAGVRAGRQLAGRASLLALGLTLIGLAAEPAAAGKGPEPIPLARVDYPLEAMHPGLRVLLEPYTSQIDRDWEIGPLRPSIEMMGWRRGYEDSPALVDDLRSQARLRVNFALPSWPMLSVAYGREQRKLVSHDWVGEIHDTVTNSASAMLWYSVGSWGVTATSRYAESVDALEIGSEWTSVDYNVSLSYQPFPSFSIAPGVGLTRARYGPTSEWVESRSANLGLYYTLDRYAVDLSAWGSYVQNDDPAGGAQSRNVDLAFKVRKQLSNGWLPLPGRQFIGLEGGLSHYEDVLFPRFTAGNAIGRIVFTVQK